MHASRRQILSVAAAGAAWALAPSAFAQNAGLRLGVQNAPAEGFDDAPMRLIHGRAPAGLEGDLYRNGPGWFRYAASQTGHWFDGDGFVQRFNIDGGRARHRARFVETRKRQIEWARQEIVMPGFGTLGAPNAPIESPDDLNAANTAILLAGDQVWALWEAGSPVRIDAETLETRGYQTLRPDLAGMPFLAHPKVEPGGRIWNLGVSGARAMVWRLAADGALEDAQIIDLGQRSYVHDWAMTERKLIIPLQPWLHERMTAPLSEGFVWRPDQPFRVLVLDKDNHANRRIYELPPMFFFHTGDAWEEADGTIRFDLCVAPGPQFAATAARDMIGGEAPYTAPGELAMATLHPDGRTELKRAGAIGDFPQTDRRRRGLQRDLVAIVGEVEGGSSGALRLVDWRRGQTQSFSFGDDQIMEEYLFAPKPGASGERDAWLIGLSLNVRARATELHVFDAANIGDGPVVSWRSRHHAPLGFHGAWGGR